MVSRLKKGELPQQIAGRLKKAAGRCIVCQRLFTLTYTVNQGRRKNSINCYIKKAFSLSTHSEKRQKTALEAEKTRIDQRHNEINQRQSFGHWEGNLVLFSRQYCHLITLRERQSRYVVAIKSNSRKPQQTADTLVST